MKRFLIIFIFLFLSASLASSMDRYIFQQISQKEGLTSTVNCIYKEKDGDVWIGTPAGLFRFNGYRLSHYPDTLLKGRTVQAIAMDKRQNLWVLTDRSLLIKSPREEDFKSIGIPDTEEGTSFHSVFMEDENIWFGSVGKLYKYTYDDGKLSLFSKMEDRPEFIFKNISRFDINTLFCNSHNGIVLVDTRSGEVSPSHSDANKEVSASLVDKAGRIWLAFYNKEIAVFDRKGNKLRSFSTSNSNLSNNVVLCMTENGQEIWVGTDGGGINIIDFESGDINVLSHISGDPSSFPAHSIKSIFTDQYGKIWAGSVRDGLICINKSQMKTYEDVHAGLSHGLSNSTVLSIHQEKGEDCIWIGTDGEGLNRLDLKSNRFTHYKSTLKTKVVSIATYSKDELALSLYADRICLFNKNTGNIRTLEIDDRNLNYIIKYTGRSINLINENNGEMLLVSNSIYRLDRKTGKCSRVNTPEGKRQTGNFFHIGNTDEGVWLHDSFDIYLLSEGADTLENKGHLNDVQIKCGHIRDDGSIWLATVKGLCRFKDGEFKFIETSLFSSASSVVCDRNSRIWIGAGNSLYAYLIKSGIFTMFGESDGAISNEYLSKPHFLSESGDIFMGGVQGLLHIDASYMIDTSEEPVINLYGLMVDNIRIKVDEEGKAEIPRYSKEMKISISVQEKDMFRHKMYRFCIGSEEYQTTSPTLSVRKIPNPGRFDVTASCTKRNGEWTEPVKIMSLTIPAPWYKTWWFTICWMMVIGLILVYVYYTVSRRRRNEAMLASREQEQKIYEEKVRMLINISHELRTPLTMIMAPLKRLTGSMDTEDKHYPTLCRAYRQSRRMRDLLNMVLDLRKMEVTGSGLKLEKINFNKWITETTDDIVKEEMDDGIDIAYNLDKSVGMAEMDRQKCETVLMNILMNAIKHSRKGDRITIGTRLTEDGKIRVSVSDMGPGLAKDIDPAKLFTRFYQSNSEQYGSGIGLSYSKILVEMHGGKIGAGNNPDIGATFWWEIPSAGEIPENEDTTSRAFLNEIIGKPSADALQMPQESIFNTEGMKLMLVDDNQDLLDFLNEAMSGEFSEIISVTSGNSALKIINSGHLPDIIVSDVNMPDGDGYWLCSEIKGNEKLRHIPLILLTARGEEKSQSDSYRLGANGFLAKPFEIETLMEMIRGLLKNKADIRKRYFDKEEDAKIDYGSNEESFILQFNKIVAENLSNPALDQQLICREMGVSRALLYNKMKAITGTGAKEYITRIRIEKAKTLIENSTLSIAEISEMTGFSAQSYFSTAFKNYTGMTPSQYKQKINTK